LISSPADYLVFLAVNRRTLYNNRTLPVNSFFREWGNGSAITGSGGFGRGGHADLEIAATYRAVS
jgi:hypothetical protein